VAPVARPEHGSENGKGEHLQVDEDGDRSRVCDRDAGVGQQRNQNPFAESEPVDAEGRQGDQQGDRDADREHGPAQIHPDGAGGDAECEEIESPPGGADQE